MFVKLVMVFQLDGMTYLADYVCEFCVNLLLIIYNYEWIKENEHRRKINESSCRSGFVYGVWRV